MSEKQAAPSPEVPKQYDPKAIEDKWYAYWQDNELFRAEVNPDKEPFTIMMPPPNVTGALHMGHALQGAVQDCIIRIKRMQGYEALWLPGTDHAGIATQNVVEKTLKEEEHKTRHDLGREKFVEKVWEWKDKYGDIITNQYRKLGTSCDWSRERFTMDDQLSEAVQKAFVRLYNDGLIYKGEYLVNWCPVDQTALSDIEVDHKEMDGHLWYVNYPLEQQAADKTGMTHVQIATTRPETIPADTAVAVSPDDERHSQLIGFRVKIPTTGRMVEIIGDEAIDAEFGTGALKVTPGHDPNDFDIGQRHNLQTLSIINIDGTMNEASGAYKGMDRFTAREKIVEDLEQQGLLARAEEYTHSVGISSRSKAVIEPMLSRQWFVSMQSLADQAIQASRRGDIEFFPPRWEKEYYRWLENIRDWVISRQLWWGHRIPAWYYTDENGDIDESRGFVVSREQPREGMVQDPDVLDTWFSSWLWPFSTLGWPGDTEDLRYFYPTQVLVSGYDILFFWVARMIMAGLHFTGQSPFHNVFMTGMVKDKYGRWMSKSLGNGIDPLEMVDRYGADAVRYCLIILCAQGQDIKLDPRKFETGRNFANKLWNAFRFLNMHLDRGRNYTTRLDRLPDNLVDRWMISRLHQTIKQVNDDLTRYRINEALMKIYSLVWDDFCDWYLELIKPPYGSSMSHEQSERALLIFEHLIRLLHPFMPFITEEIWHHLRERTPGQSLIRAEWPEENKELIHEDDVALFGDIQQMITSLRNIKAEMNVPDKQPLTVQIKAADELTARTLQSNRELFEKLLRIEKLEIATGIERPEASASAVVRGSEVFVPLSGLIDFQKERERIRSEIYRLHTFLEKTEKKLSDKKFLNNAPEHVVENERKKKQDAQTNLEKFRRIYQDLN